MAFTKLITLDSMGYTSDPSIIIDRVLRHFFVANYSQTNVHYGQIKSLPWLIQQHPQNYSYLQTEIEDAIKALLYGYFDNVECNVTIEPVNEATEIDQIITVDVNVYRGAKKWSGGHLLQVVKNRVSKIEEI